MLGESNSANYQNKFQRCTTSMVRTGKPHIFKLVFRKKRDFAVTAFQKFTAVLY